MAMKILITLTTVTAFAACNSAEACYIIDKHQVQLGVDYGIEGRCANNGWRIACTVSRQDSEISCEGPEGVFNGTQIDYLVLSACGCTQQQSLQLQLEEQLKDYP